MRANEQCPCGATIQLAYNHEDDQDAELAHAEHQAWREHHANCATTLNTMSHMIGQLSAFLPQLADLNAQAADLAGR